MELNKIYRYYGMKTGQAYEPIKIALNEAFTGFDGVSFETVAATEDTDEQYLIYLNAEKRMWLSLYQPSDPQISINFSNGNSVVINRVSSSVAYRQFNIVRTAYGVVFSRIGTTNDITDVLTNDIYFSNFFAVGEPNVFIYTGSSSNTTSTGSIDYWYSDLHDIPESFSQYSSFTASTVTRTKLSHASSMVQPIDCKHLYRLEFSGGETGKINIGDKYFILGCRYALEYDPNDDGVEV